MASISEQQKEMAKVKRTAVIKVDNTSLLLNGIVVGVQDPRLINSKL
jgi:hypothetical protein